ncbi:MAG: acyltransferase domain-containing protein [Acidimicrobiales bacterium]
MSTAGGRPDPGWPGIAFLFPGEGSVQPGAGRPWRDHPSWTVVERLSDQIDVDLADLLLHAPAEQLRRVESAHHAAVALGLLLWDALARSEVRPSLCLGHGVGEYVALTAGGALGLDALAAVVAARGTALAEVAERRPGTSSSVVGLDQDYVHGLCTMAAGQVWVTQHNAVRRVTVAGVPDAVAAVVGWAQDAGADGITALPVDAALHCPLVEPATTRLERALSAVAWRAPVVPVISSLLARPYPDHFEPQSLLLAHLVSPLRWRHALTSAVRHGAAAFVQLGGGLPGTRHADMTPLPTVDLAVPDDLDFVNIVVRRQRQLHRQPQRPEPAGEVLTVAERLVVSPVAGRFVASGPVFSEAGVGTEVRAGQRFGRVGESDVRSMFSGQLMGLLARPGERVTVGQPIAWIRT